MQQIAVMPVKRRNVRRFGGVALALVVAGCAGGSMPQNVAPAPSNRTSARPNTTASDLIYVSEGGINQVSVLNYPGFHRVARIKGFRDPAGVCADTVGNVWVVNSKSTSVMEFARGGRKPIATLDDSAASLPLACAVDPTTGNLAVTDMKGSSGGAVLLYTDAQGSPTVYNASNLAVAYFCAYDANGDLFVDGLDSNYAFVLLELPYLGKTFETIAVSGTIGFPGGMAWDGQYLAVGDESYGGKHAAAIDDLALGTGSTATIVATVPLQKNCDILQFAIVSGKVAAPDTCVNTLFVYPYPGGGQPLKHASHLQYPVAVAVSVGS